MRSGVSADSRRAKTPFVWTRTLVETARTHFTHTQDIFQDTLSEEKKKRGILHISFFITQKERRRRKAPAFFKDLRSFILLLKGTTFRLHFNFSS